jgi:hypothetical protein
VENSSSFAILPEIEVISFGMPNLILGFYLIIDNLGLKLPYGYGGCSYTRVYQV